MSIFYRSRRVGKGGREFWMIKFKTLANGSDRQVFSNEATYTRFGKFLRRTKLDEVPQLWNVLRGEMGIFGYRPEEKRTWDILPQSIKDVLITQKPGIIDMSSLYFMDEERILQQSNNPSKTYWEKLKPMKFILQFYYVENKSFLLNMSLVWSFIRKVVKR